VQAKNPAWAAIRLARAKVGRRRTVVMCLSARTQRRRNRRHEAWVACLAAHLKHTLSKSNRRSRRLTRRDETIVRLGQISPQQRTCLRILRNLRNSPLYRDGEFWPDEGTPARFKEVSPKTLDAV
jgi:hypothetical protein